MDESEDKPLMAGTQDTNRVNAIIDRIGFGHYQLIVLIAISLFMFVDGAEASLITIVSYILEDEWNLGSTEIGVLGGIILLGMSIGYCTSGLIETRLGRMNIMYLGMGIVLFFGIISAFMPEIWSLAFTRMVVGYGIGLGTPASVSIATEVNPTSLRGFNILFIMLMFGLGQLFVVALSMLLTPDLDSSNWRLTIIVTALPTVPGLILMYFFGHESPLYLARDRRYESATEVLNTIAKANKQPELTNDEVDDVYKTLPANLGNARAKFGLIFDKWHRSLSIKVQVIFAAIVVIYYGTVFIFPYIIDLEDDEAFMTLIYMMISYLVQIPFLLTTMYIIEKKPFGRKNTSILILGLIAILSVVLIISDNSTLRLVFLLFAQGLCNSVFSLFYVYIPEAHETELRTMSVGFVNTLGRLMGSIGVYWYFFMIDQASELAFGFNAALATAVAVLAMTLPFDTTGRPLDASH